MEQLRRELVSLVGGGGSIGDWELVTSEPVTQLSVRPGYGASRKLSFLQVRFITLLWQRRNNLVLTMFCLKKSCSVLGTYPLNHDLMLSHQLYCLNSHSFFNSYFW